MEIFDQIEFWIAMYGPQIIQVVTFIGTLVVLFRNAKTTQNKMLDSSVRVVASNALRERSDKETLRLLNELVLQNKELVKRINSLEYLVERSKDNEKA